MTPKAGLIAVLFLALATPLRAAPADAATAAAVRDAATSFDQAIGRADAIKAADFCAAEQRDVDYLLLNVGLRVNRDKMWKAAIDRGLLPAPSTQPAVPDVRRFYELCYVESLSPDAVQLTLPDGSHMLFRRSGQAFKRVFHAPPEPEVVRERELIKMCSDIVRQINASRFTSLAALQAEIASRTQRINEICGGANEPVIAPSSVATDH